MVKVGRFIVMDIVFYGSSLNYDQGTGNYQELKKITKWDGRQYTLVSRYALRYSLLETANKMGLWDIAEGDKLQLAGEEGKKVIQPATELLLSGEILKYPEFDLFGYLITSTDPQNFRTAPVKISHAVSMTPFNYDALFNANIGLANRMRKIRGEMSPNPFTAEEHVTFYQYTVVVDVDNVGNIEVYVNEGKEIKLGDDKDKWKVEKVNDSDRKIKIILKKDKGKKTKSIEQCDEVDGKLSKLEKLAIINYSLKKNESENDPVKERIKQLILTILNLKRSIKGRDEDLSPKLMVVGIYKNHPYKTYKDRIFLVDEYTEESYDEIEEREENGKKIVKVKHVVSKSKKPVFEVILNRKSGNYEKKNPENDNNKKSQNEENKDKEVISEISENKVWSFIEQIFNESKTELEQVKVFYDPSVEVRIK